MKNNRVSIGDIVYVLDEGEWVLAKVMELNEDTVEPTKISVRILASQGFRSVTFQVTENEYLSFDEKEKL